MQTVLRRLALDAVAVEVVQAFRRAGIEAILLKGRSIAERLYPDSAKRGYRDVDLLVAPERHEQASRILVGLGFADYLAGAREHERAYCGHATTWLRDGGRAIVDLHFTISGARADPAVVFAALRAHTRPLLVGAEPLTVLDDVGLALNITLHAAQHGLHKEQPLADLARALATFDRSAMEAAAALATRIDALPAFVTGLRLVPAGHALAEALGRGVEIPAATAVKALTDVRGTGSISRLLAEPGRRRPLLMVRRAFPSPTVLRRTMPLARRGPAGLVAAYTLRPLWMAIRLPAAIRAWRTAARTWRD